MDSIYSMAGIEDLDAEAPERRARPVHTIDHDPERERFERAAKDRLTNAYNKSYLLDRLKTDFPYAKRHQTPLTLLLFDIDGFQRINQCYGPAAGDYVLAKFASALTQAIRIEDVLARVSGDMFAVLLRDVDAKQALMLTDRLCQLIQHTHFEFDAHTIAVSVSAGISTLGEAPDPSIQIPQDLVDHAVRSLEKSRNAKLPLPLRPNL